MIANYQIIIDSIRNANVVSDATVLRGDIPLQEQGIDSLGFFSIVLLLEEKFDIKVADEDIERLTTIDSLIAYINDKTGRL